MGKNNVSEIPGNILKPFIAFIVLVDKRHFDKFIQADEKIYHIGGSFSKKALIKPRGTANSHISIKSHRNPHRESPPERKIPQITVVFMACPST